MIFFLLLWIPFTNVMVPSKCFPKFFQKFREEEGTLSARKLFFLQMPPLLQLQQVLPSAEMGHQCTHKLQKAPKISSSACSLKVS